MMNDKIYMKENKASRKQQIMMQLTFLDDTLRRLEREKISALADIVSLKAELSELKDV